MLSYLIRSYFLTVAGVLLVTAVRGQLSVSVSLSDAVVCIGNNTATANSVVSGATGSVSYAWSVSPSSVTFNPPTSPNPVMTFGQVADTYTITLIVTDDLGTETAFQTVQVIERPVAAFSSNEQVVCPGGCITFTDESVTDQTAGSNSIMEWHYITTGVTNDIYTEEATDCFNNIGCFDVKLGVVDFIGCASTLGVLNICVEDCPPINPFITYTAACPPSLEVDFEAHPIPTLATSWLWDFGDNITSTLENPTHTYSLALTYTVTLTASYENPDHTETVSTSIEVGTAPSIGFSLPSTACLDETVTVSGPSTGNNYEYTVSPSANISNPNTASPDITFPAADTYTISLTADMPGGCTAISEQTIVVGDSITVDFVGDTLTTCLTPFDVQFTPTTTGSVTGYDWDFGNPATMVPPTSSSQNPTVTFNNSGQYEVCLTASNEGCSAPECKSQYIQIIDPVASFDTVGFDPCIPADVSFTSTTNAVEWIWDFGDNIGTSTDQNPTYTYTTSGCFDVTMIAVSALGCSTTVVRPNLICTNTPPNPQFTLPGDTICEGQTLCTINNTTGNIDNDSWAWTVNGSNLSDLPNLCYQFYDTGIYTICLSVDNNDCAADSCIDKSIYVHPVSPLYFEVIRDCQNPMEVSVNITSPPGAFDYISNYWWNFGDGSPNVYSVMDTTHTYSPEGEYTITLFSNNDTIDCDNGSERIVEVYDPVNNFVPSETETCPGTIYFTDFPVEGVDSLGWLFGDSPDIVWYENPYDAQWYGVEHTYTEEGLYSVSLILAVRGIEVCYDTLTMPDLINILGEGLDASFTFEPVDFCDNDYFGIQFNGLPLSGVENWYWDFDGDGVYDSQLQNPIHYFSNWNGEAWVTLHIEDSDGCSSTLSEYIEAVPAPDVEVDISASVACQDSLVMFTVNPLSDPFELDHYEWDFGDDSTATGTASTQWHQYVEDSVYDITLITESQNGCRDTTVVLGGVIVDDPEASFTADLGFLYCEDVLVEFCNTSVSSTPTDYVLYTGDMDSLNFLQPPGCSSKNYNPFGVYDATLVATNAAGCTDTSIINNVLDPWGALGPPSILSMDTANCAPFDVTFSAYNPDDSCYTYNWTWGDNSLPCSDCGTIVDHEYDTAGTFMVRLIMTNCINYLCSYEDSIEVTVAPMQVTAWQDTTICFGDSAQLHASVNVLDADTNGYRYEWTDATWLSADSVQHPYASPPITTTFVVTGKYSDCAATDSVTVTVNQLPIISNMPTDSVCFGDPPFVLADANPSGGSFSGDYVAPFNVFDPTNVAVGCHTIIYTYTDANVCTNTDTSCITVLPLPIINFPHLDSLCHDAAPVLLDQATPPGGGYSGSGVNSISPPYEFHPPSPGIHQLTYTKEDVFGCIDSALQTITVNPNPVSSFIFDDVCIGDSMIFINTSNILSGSIDSTTWDFGDNTGVTAFSPLPHLYANSQSFTVQLESTSVLGCSNGTSDTVVVFALPVISNMPTDSVCFGDPPFVLADANPSGGSFSGDYVTPPNVFDPTNVAVGCHTIIYTYTDANVCTNTDTSCITVLPLPIINFPHLDSLCHDAAPILLNQATPPDGVYSGSGVNSISPPYEFHPPSPGIHQLTYTKEDVFGCIDSALQTITVNPNPENNFSVENHCFADSMLITNSTTILTGSVSTWSWAYSDGGLDSDSIPLPYMFEDAGTYSIDLVSISELGCSDSMTQLVSVHPVPKAEFSVTDVCLTHQSPFLDQSLVASGSIVNWDWTFPDFPFNVNGSFPNPEHLFSTYGNLPVTLIVSTEFGCIDSVTNDAIVHPLPLLSIEHEDRCFGELIEFQGVSTIPSGSVVSFDWTFGDAATSQLLAPTHLYSNPGLYDVQFTGISNLGCSDSVLVEVEIFELPHAGFTVFPEREGCEPLTVTFIDTSSIPYPYYITDRYWNFGNGSESEGIQPTFVYDTAGVYDVSLMVISNKGCSDSTFTADYITVHPNPTAGFSYLPKYISSLFSEVNFNDLSNGASSWYWSFGDGQFSVETNPEHFYADTGDYRVIQIVSNAFQCVDTAEAILTVWPQPTFYIPNSFTPNNDGVNETFFGQGYGIKELTMKIFDRWGEELFVTNDLNTAWDGTYKGTQVEQGIYVYLITTITVNGEFQQYAGHVTLHR